MYRDKSSMGNRLAPQKDSKSMNEDAKKKAREQAMMNRLSGKPGKMSS